MFHGCLIQFCDAGDFLILVDVLWLRFDCEN